MSLYLALKEKLDDGKSAEEAAARVATRRDLAELVMPLLVSAARDIERTAVRRKVQAIPVKRTTGVDPMTVRRNLIEDSFPLPSGGRVKYLEATIEDHLARAGWQRSLAGAVISDAEFHEACARTIQLHGVNCLADVPEEARPAKAA